MENESLDLSEFSYLAWYNNIIIIGLICKMANYTQNQSSFGQIYKFDEFLRLKGSGQKCPLELTFCIFFHLCSKVADFLHVTQHY